MAKWNKRQNSVNAFTSKNIKARQSTYNSFVVLKNEIRAVVDLSARVTFLPSWPAETTKYCLMGPDLPEWSIRAFWWSSGPVCLASLLEHHAWSVAHYSSWLDHHVPLIGWSLVLQPTFRKLTPVVFTPPTIFKFPYNVLFTKCFIPNFPSWEMSIVQPGFLFE